MANAGFIALAAASFFFWVAFEAGAGLEDASTGAFALEFIMGTRTSEAGIGITTVALWSNL
jgi:hypothetical protein